MLSSSIFSYALNKSSANTLTLKCLSNSYFCNIEASYFPRIFIYVSHAH